MKETSTSASPPAISLAISIIACRAAISSALLGIDFLLHGVAAIIKLRCRFVELELKAAEFQAADLVGGHHLEP